MALPFGTIRSLKGNHDAIVAVVVAALAFAALAAGASTWATIVIVVATQAFYHRRRSDGEAHQIRASEQKIEAIMAKAEVTKARQPDRLTYVQAPLPLGLPEPEIPRRRRDR